MSKAVRIGLIWTLLLGVNFSSTARDIAKTKGQPVPMIAIRVYGDAGVQVRLLKSALNKARLILRDAGVVVEPVFCIQNHSPAVCKHPPDPMNIPLRFVLSPGAPIPGTERDTMGYVSGLYIVVYYSRVLDMTRSSNVPIDMILGCVVAHEIGHVLLGPNSHSGTGIMTASWGDSELHLIRLGVLGFEPFQKKRITAYVLAHQRQSPDVGTGSTALNQR